MWTIQTCEPSETGPLTFRLSAGAVKTVGRATRADFVLDAALVSRFHCRLSVTPTDTLEVEDLQSTNGTWVNDERVGTAAARGGRSVAGGAGRAEGGAGAEVYSQERVRPTLPADGRRLAVSRVHPRLVGKREQDGPDRLESASRNRRPAGPCGRSRTRTACLRRRDRALQSPPIRPGGRRRPDNVRACDACRTS